jgi:hypothetical protein
VLLSVPEALLVKPPLQQAKSRRFVEGAGEVASYLAGAHGIGIPH